MKQTMSIEMAKELTARIIEKYDQRKMTKLPIDNIAFPQLNLGVILGKTVNMDIVTKEHPDGCVYDKGNFQMVMRLINGRLLDDIGRPDVYAWTTGKVAKAKKQKPIGFCSVEGALNYSAFLATVQTEEDKNHLTEMLIIISKMQQDLIHIHTEAEERQVIEVSREMLDEGIDAIPNSYDIEWAPKGATHVNLTSIKEGDALVIEQCSFGPAVYVVGRDEYRLTHAASAE